MQTLAKDTQRLQIDQRFNLKHTGELHVAFRTETLQIHDSPNLPEMNPDQTLRGNERNILKGFACANKCGI